jgi:hypothetical protein
LTQNQIQKTKYSKPSLWVRKQIQLETD